MWTIWLPGRWPSLNQLLDAKAHWASYHKLKMAWLEPTVLLLRAAKVPQLKRVTLAYAHYRVDRRSDPSNLAAAAMKIIEDAMVTAKILPSDGWNVIAGFGHRFVDSDANGIELTISEA